MDQKFHYLSCVPGRVVPRYGAPAGTYIGARRTRLGFDWSPERVVAIPVEEWVRYQREYGRAVADGALRVRTEAEYKSAVDGPVVPDRPVEPADDGGTRGRPKSKKGG